MKIKKLKYLKNLLTILTLGSISIPLTISCSSNINSNNNENNSSNNQTNYKEGQYNWELAPIGISQKSWDDWKQFTLGKNSANGINLIKESFINSIDNPINGSMDYNKEVNQLQLLLNLGNKKYEENNIPDVANIDIQKLEQVLNLWFNYDNNNWVQNNWVTSKHNKNLKSMGYTKSFSEISNLKLNNLNYVKDNFISSGSISFELTLANSTGIRISNKNNKILVDDQFNSWIKIQINSNIYLDFELVEKDNKTLKLYGLKLVIDAKNVSKVMESHYDYKVNDWNYWISNGVFEGDFDKYLKEKIENSMKNNETIMKQWNLYSSFDGFKNDNLVFTYGIGMDNNKIFDILNNNNRLVNEYGLNIENLLLRFLLQNLIMKINFQYNLDHLN